MCGVGVLAESARDFSRGIFSPEEREANSQPASQVTQMGCWRFTVTLYPVPNTPRRCLFQMGADPPSQFYNAPTRLSASSSDNSRLLWYPCSVLVMRLLDSRVIVLAVVLPWSSSLLRLLLTEASVSPCSAFDTFAPGPSCDVPRSLHPHPQIALAHLQCSLARPTLPGVRAQGRAA